MLNDFSIVHGVWTSVGGTFLFLCAVWLFWNWRASQNTTAAKVACAFFLIFGVVLPVWLHGAEMGNKEEAQVRELVANRDYTVGMIWPRENEFNARFGRCDDHPYIVRYELTNDGDIKTWIPELDDLSFDGPEPVYLALPECDPALDSAQTSPT